MPPIPGYTVAETLREDKEIVLLRGWREGDQSPILLESTVHADAGPRSQEWIERTYAIQGELDSSWALTPVGQDHIQGRPALIFDDPGGDILSRLLPKPRPLADSLRLALGMTAALGKLHARGIIHKDIRPANVLVDAAGRVRLMGFGAASRLPRERQEPGPLEGIAGTLAYMSPEQTGRMNRYLDSRSDLYSLGITLYELFTGVLPFSAQDPLEWVHCHIARPPIPPHAREAGVPGPLSAVVMKLLAKMAEERYQTAAGVEADLKRCLADWERRGAIDPFPLGSRDMSAQLLIPEKLYGREKERRQLLQAFGRVEAGGRRELVLVSGYSGIGKSSLVNELHRVLGPRGLFAGGKFEAQRRETPYSIFVEAFQSLIRRILAGSPEEVSAWRTALFEAVGSDGRVLTDLIPELEMVLGPQPEVPTLSLAEARNRLHSLFAQILGAFARPEHPLALFLDDLQWQDGASLALFEHLATHPDLRHLLLVGAYRDNEVGPSHPLARALEAIRAADAGLTELRLAPLAEADVRRLIADALHRPGQEAGPLARCVYEKTGGNPFFTLQFLHFLHDERLIGFDVERGIWNWDLERIQAQGITDNVAELVAGTLGRLPVETLEALQWIACLGASVKTALLVRILERAEGKVHAALRPAVLAGMLIPGGGLYRILHDRIREVAYSLIPEPRRSDMHVAIGRRLLAGQEPGAVAEGLFFLVDQFNRGMARIEAASERDVVRRLNAMAGRKAMISAAYGSASVYLALARSLLPAEAWERDYPGALALWMDGAEADFMAGQEDRAEALFGEILARARTRGDRAGAYLLRGRVYQAAGRYQPTVEACLEGLRILGAAIPPPEAGAIGAALAEASASVKSLLEGRRMADLADAPPATGAETSVFVALSAEALNPAHLSQSPYLPLLIQEGVRATLEQGPVTESAYLYSAYAFMLTLGGDAEAGLEFSEMSLRLYGRLGGIRARGALLFAQGALALWRHPFSGAAAILEEAVRTAERVGDANTAGNASVSAIWARLEAGESLERLAEAAGHYLALAMRIRTKPIEGSFQRILRFLETYQSSRGMGPLRGRGEEAMAADRNEEAEVLEAFRKGGLSVGIALIHIMNQISAFVFGRHEEAFAHGREAERSLGPMLITSHERYHPFFQALAAAALYDDAPTERKKELAAIVKAKLEPLRRMAGLGPANYGDRLALVQAEAARIEGRDLEAMRLYEQAIRSAREQGFVHHEGLANEIAARFYRGRSFETIAQTYFKNARAGYLQWGATAKVRQMDRLYPALKEPKEPRPGGGALLDAPLEALDLMAVVQASQAVSGELVLERFLERLLTLMLENAGADRGALLRPKDGEFVVEAEAEARRDGVAVRLPEEALSPDRLPASMIRFAARTRERVLLDDATAPGPYAEDPYVLAHRPRSVMALPLVKQSEVVAVLYLENRLATAAFTPGQVSVVQLLASQAAVSLQNARLYRSLQRADERFSKAFRNSPTPMAILRSKDQVLLDANDRFLATYGLPREELLGRPFQELGLISLEETERVNALIAAQGYLREEEVSVQNRAGKSLSLLTSVEPIDLGGEACALVTHLDITVRKQMESQLRQAQKMEAIGSLAGGVAHDFNNLLTAINGYSELAMMGKEATSPDYEYLKAIRTSGERAAGLTRQLLAFGRKETVQTQAQSLNAIVAEMEGMLRRLIEENVEIQTRLDPEAGSVNVDKGQVVQILMNLVVNARDAMPEGGRILVETRRVWLDKPTRSTLLDAAPGAYVALTVKDTGTGMTPEVKAKIFEPFFTTKAVGKGTGLGLAVVYGVVKQLGGGIELKSEPGKGTTFCIYFPEVRQEALAASEYAGRKNPESYRGSETILVVEDEESVREFIKQALAAQDYTVLESRSGVEALHLLEQAEHRIDLVVTDLIMPDMGGRELASHIRAHHPALPVVYTSGYSKDLGDFQEALANAEYFLAKPFGPFDLTRKVREILEHSR